MRMCGEIATLIKITSYADRKVISVYSNQLERNQHGDCPAEDSIIDANFFLVE